MVAVREFVVSSYGPANLFNLTTQVRTAVREAGVRNGFVELLSVGSTGALVKLSEDAYEDFEDWVRRSIPFDSSHRHPGNAFAHLRSSFIGCGLILAIVEGDILLDSMTVALLENTAGRKRRRISVIITGED